ncbi:glycosyltransferase family A protein, partial [Staphylococcus epidermidis]|uniref:glycosyltransferase family A protein n=1 Tax=Staphylococcus epidermidis TaxID=1282 RepID=UPI0037D9FDF6
MNKLTIILTYYNPQQYITPSLHTINQQPTQHFNFIILSHPSTHQSKKLIHQPIKHYHKNIPFIDLDQNTPHPHPPNIPLQQLQTPYFIFLDPHHQLPSYPITFYLQNFNNTHRLIPP